MALDRFWIDLHLPATPINSDPKVEPDLRNLTFAIQSLAMGIGQQLGIDTPAPGYQNTEQASVTLGTDKKRLYVVASEDIDYGEFVNLWDDGGILKGRLSDATNGSIRPAVGISNSVGTVAAGGTVEIIVPIAHVASVGGMTPGDIYYISTTPGAIQNTAPVAPDLIQPVGVAISPTELLLNMNYATASSGGGGGGGTVTSFSFVNANGFTGNVANPATTPALTLTLDNGAVSTAKIADDAVTFAKLQNLNTNVLLGRDTAGSGDAEEITLGVSLEFDGAQKLQRAALTGDVTAPANDNALTIANLAVTTAKINDKAVTFTKMQDIATDKLIGRDQAGSGPPAEIGLNVTLEFDGANNIQRAALTGDVTAPAGNNATTITNDAVSNAKLANMPTMTLKGNDTGGSADPQDLTVPEVVTMLGVPETLTANRDYYVDPVGGNDTNDGLTALTAFKTLQHAVNVSAAIFKGNYFVHIHLADGAYAYTEIVGQGGSGSYYALQVTGNVATPANVDIPELYIQGEYVRIEGVDCPSILVDQLTNLEIEDCRLTSLSNFGAGAQITFAGANTIYGNSVFWLQLLFGGFAQFTAGSVTTFSGQAFSSAGVLVDVGGRVYVDPTASIAGTATGKRFNVSDSGSSVESGGHGRNFFPGNVAGSAVEFGTYDGVCDDLVIGTTIQAWDSDLDAYAAIGTTGIVARTGAGTATTRTIQGTANEISVSQGDGVAGNPILSLPSALTFTGKTVTGGTFDGIAMSGTWTGSPTLSGNPKFTGIPIYESAAPAFRMNETDQGADLKLWQVVINGQNWQVQTLTDAGATLINAYSINRNGALTIAHSLTAQAVSDPIAINIKGRSADDIGAIRFLNNAGSSETARMVAASATNLSVALGASAATALNITCDASHVNYLRFNATAAGSTPFLEVTGSDANISFAHRTKGTGAHQFLTNGGAQTQLQITHTASAVNRLDITGAATTARPSISAAGSDANIGITLTPKGTGDLVLTSGILDLSGASAGRIKFPATANLSSDANTLDDYQEATFTATGTGFSSSPTATWSYTITGNSVHLNIVAISATSNATTFTVTGHPAEARPATAKRLPARIQNNGTFAYGHIEIGTAGTNTVYNGPTEAAWTASGTKSIQNMSGAYTLV